MQPRVIAQAAFHARIKALATRRDAGGQSARVVGARDRRDAEAQVKGIVPSLIDASFVLQNLDERQQIIRQVEGDAVVAAAP